MTHKSNTPRRDWLTPVVVSAVLAALGFGLLIWLGGCQSHSTIAPANSAASRTIDEKRPRTKYTVTVTPPEAKR